MILAVAIHFSLSEKEETARRSVFCVALGRRSTPALRLKRCQWKKKHTPPSCFSNSLMIQATCAENGIWNNKKGDSSGKADKRSLFAEPVIWEWPWLRRQRKPGRQRRAAMLKQHHFLASYLPFLFLLPSSTDSSHCHVFPGFVCRKHNAFVPGHNLIGEGVDITTLDRKGAYVVDTSQWQGPNGTCTLCRNPLMDGQLQKLPLAGVDWRTHSDCHRQTSSSVENSDMDVANAMAREVINDWKIELGLPTEATNSLGFSKAQVAFAGSQSQMTIYAHKKSRQDRHVFLRQEVSCKYYRLRLLQSPSLLAHDFSRAVDRLPRKHNSEEYQHFINTYGTHYISHVQLGGRVRHLLAMRTCTMALWGFTASKLKECLNLETSVGHDWLFGSFVLNSKCQKLWGSNAHGNFYDANAGQRIEVVGGDKQVEMTFSTTREIPQFSEWMESAKVNPGLVSYSLLPLHTLLKRTDPKRDLMKQAIADHINQRALRRDCPQKCPPWSSDESCTCMCQADSITNHMCCARERGMAYLSFYVHSGANLWGDHFTATDAFVKVFFQDQEKRTAIVRNDNNPQWSEILDFGAVTLTGSDSFTLELWDKDVWHDDLLQKCRGNLVAGRGITRLRCYPSHGYVRFSYLLECGRTLAGPSCQDYVPLRLPTSYFNNTNSPFHA
uniref:Perforin-1-like n=1 Tax=Pogona vitticeps TaxID=103695 RepID=A0A6J0V651_9SAUR